MKKFMFLATMASVALASCTSEEKMEMTSEAKKISFDAPVFNTQTRANVFGEMYNQTTNADGGIETEADRYNTQEQFHVYAVEHEGSFTSTTWGTNRTSYYINDDVSYKSAVNGWATSTDKYWPKDGKLLTFAAYSPANMTIEGGTAPTVTCTDNGIQIENFAVASNIEKQFDLMYSDFKPDCESSSMTGADEYNGVPIEFNHALSSIKFCIVKGVSVKNTVTLHSLSLYGVYNKGSFDQGVTYETDATSGDVTIKNNPSWTIATDETALTKDDAYGIVTKDKTFGTTEKIVNEHDVLLLPQVLTDNSVIAISYTVNGNKYEKNIKLNEFKNGTENLSSWVAGYRYKYVLNLDAETIYFAPNVPEWTDGGTYIYNL